MICPSDPQFHENASHCYQCSKCSAGCPVAEEMDMLPHQIIHSVALGEEEAALDSIAIWICAGCYTCAVRCPNDINIASVMDDLRKRAVESNRPCPKPEVLQFHQAFLADMNRRGRVHELRFMGEYNLKNRHALFRKGIRIVLPSGQGRERNSLRAQPDLCRQGEPGK